MKYCYLDTSALRHLLIPHAQSTSLRRTVRSAGSLTASSEVATTELLRLAARVPQLSVHQVDAVLDNIELVALNRDQLRGAGLLPDLPSGTFLRSLDAIHIQAALDFGATEFITSDQRQADAAEAVGLLVTRL